MNEINNNLKHYALLFGGVFIYSLSGFFLKFASLQPILSLPYFLFCFLSVIMLASYAIIWQQVLKHIELSSAMMFKPLVLVLSVLYACILFNESVSLINVMGIVLIMGGMSYIGISND